MIVTPPPSILPCLLINRNRSDVSEKDHLPFASPVSPCGGPAFGTEAEPLAGQQSLDGGDGRTAEPWTAFSKEIRSTEQTLARKITLGRPKRLPDSSVSHIKRAEETATGDFFMSLEI